MTTFQQLLSDFTKNLDGIRQPRATVILNATPGTFFLSEVWIALKLCWVSILEGNGEVEPAAPAFWWRDNLLAQREPKTRPWGPRPRERLAFLFHCNVGRLPESLSAIAGLYVAPTSSRPQCNPSSSSRSQCRTRRWAAPGQLLSQHKPL